MIEPALTANITHHDYTLNPEAGFVWIHIGAVSVLINAADGAVVVSTYKQGEDDEQGCVVVSL